MKSINITVHGGTLTQEEMDATVRYAQSKYPNRELTGLDITLDGDEVELQYHLAPVPFERIRRITGYLVGTIDQWNNAKAAEEHDRVKHAVGCSCCGLDQSI